jgi:hypothetical protein
MMYLSGFGNVSLFGVKEVWLKEFRRKAIVIRDHGSGFRV